MDRVGPQASPTAFENGAQQASPPPLPPPPGPRPANIATTATSQISAPSTSISPSDNNNNSPSTIRTIQGRTFAERASLANDAKQSSDVSADVYFRYVSLKSNEHTDNRSRSYHGPKNTNSNQVRDQFAFNQASNTMKNLSSTQSVAELPLSPAMFPTSPTIPIHFRDHCVRELIDTETNYVHALEMIINCFAKPLEVLLKRDQNQLIFGHIKYFHHVHSSLQTDLVKAASRLFNEELLKLPSPTRRALNGHHSEMLAASNSSSLSAQQFSPLSSPTDFVANNRAPRISTCFLNAREKFLKYGEYCASLSKTQALLDELNKNETIAAQLNRCQQEANEGRFKLRDLLSLPMQRILKYHLLLAQMIKNTNSSNEDYQGLKRAHETLVDLGQYINEVKRDTEVMQIVSDIEQSIIGLNMPVNTKLEDYGRLIMDGNIRIRGPNEHPKIKLPHDSKRYVFVFDKVILMCKEIGPRRYQYKEALVLSEFDLEVNPINACETLGRHKDKYGYNFNLTRSSDKAIYSFYPKSQEAKGKWINSIQRAMDNIRPSSCRSTNHKFLMHTFERASSCDHCGKLLLGLYYQGYRCQVCFSSVHKKCISSVRSCGPALTNQKLNSTRASNRSRRTCNNEPPSPSMRSNCSDNGQSLFMQFSPSISSSTHCVDNVTAKVEYSNLKGRLDNVASSSFRETNGSKTLQQRPASSMTNVSLQNSANQLHHKRLLRESASTPTISRQPSPKVKAIQDFDGDEDSGELRILKGDIILLYKNAIQQVEADEGVARHLSQLRISSRVDSSRGAWWFGRNLRTGHVGRFPSEVVELLMDSYDGSENMNVDEIAENDPSHLEQMNSYVNFILNDRPWFCGRMEREEAQTLLENKPHETFLVRVSPKHNGSYVISLNFNSQVKHMRIYISKDNQLYLSQNRYFKSVIELVSWYEHNSLVESFHMLDARLSRPFKVDDETAFDLNRL